MERKPGVISQEIEDGLILYDPDSDQAFVLNRTGALAWANAEKGEGEIAGMIASEFQVSAEQALSDVREFITELKNRGLLR